MRVKIKFFATFCKNHSDEETRDYPPGTTVGDVLAELTLSLNKIGAAVMIDNRHVEKGHTLKDGDVILIIPLVCGG